MDNEQTFTLNDLQLDRVDLVTAGANPGAHVLIAKMDDTDILSVEAVETLDVRTEEVCMSEETPAVDETVAKADFEAVQKQLDEMAAALEVAKADATAKADEVAKMLHEKRQAEFVAKARDLSNLGEAESLGALLLEVADAAPETFKQLEQLLKAANAQLEKGALFAQFGKSDAGDEPVDAVDKVNALAKAKVEAGAAKTLQLAKLQVLQENRELASEYSNATRVR